jgi:rhodanese-related sulfurtransferase
MVRFLPIVVALAALAAGCKPSEKPVKPIDPKESYGMVLNDFAVLIDVREEAELKKSGTAKPAKWIPFSKIEKNAPEWLEFKKSFPKDKQAIFYCAGGGRAQLAAESAAKDGIEARNMGGFKDWAQAGLPTRALTP